MNETPHEPPKLTPTQRLEQRAKEQHEQLMAALTKPTFEASEKITVGRDSKGYHYDVAGVAGEAETLMETAGRVLAVCEMFNSELDFAPPVDADVTRNAKGDHQWSASGDPARTVKLAKELDAEFPLSRTQEAGRKYLPNEMGKK